MDQYIVLDRLLSLENPSKGLNIFMGEAFKTMIPELVLQYKYDQDSPYHDSDLWTHTLKVVCAVPKDKVDLRWAALLHDVAKPWSRSKNKKGYSNYINHEQFGAYMAEVILQRLGMPQYRIDYICDVIKHHLEDGNDLKPYDDMCKKLNK